MTDGFRPQFTPGQPRLNSPFTLTRWGSWHSDIVIFALMGFRVCVNGDEINNWRLCDYWTNIRIRWVTTNRRGRRRQARLPSSAQSLINSAQFYLWGTKLQILPKALAISAACSTLFGIYVDLKTRAEWNGEYIPYKWKSRKVNQVKGGNYKHVSYVFSVWFNHQWPGLALTCWLNHYTNTQCTKTYKNWDVV